ncbi:threonylcarbamoyl-AMP synthase [Candidatus Uhrbacteria bacterium]|nr:threonylcarbamoyl-AMP synthase [Candidatus Uhrbacteria bacterium]
MEVHRISRNRLDAKILKNVVNIIRRGGVVAYPTDTAYGLAVDPANPGALKKLFAIKGRGENKSSPLISASYAQALKVGRLAGLARTLAKKYWPGPLTIVLPLAPRHGLARLACGADDTVAIRVPASGWARALARKLGRPITSTSANLSGQPSAYSGRAVKRSFDKARLQPDMILDAGPLPRRKPSTIVRVGAQGVEILRRGSAIVKT